MAYKSKRTRDLQGEVQAGTNVSVSETTKPDGTKVYTLSAEGGEITISGSGLRLVGNVLTNLMAQRMGWTDANMGKINWIDDNGDDVLIIDPLEKIFIGDAEDNNDFIIKHINSENRLIRGTLQIAKEIDSTEGVSLQTLADMVNSAATYEIGMNDAIDDETAYIFTDYFSAQIESIGNFYTPVSTLYFINNIPVIGLKPLNNGLYKIDISFQAYITSQTSPNLSFLIASILKVDAQGNYDSIEKEIQFFPASDVSNERYICEITLNTLIEVSSDEAICIVVKTDSVNNDTGIGLLGTNPILSIQKVR